MQVTKVKTGFNKFVAVLLIFALCISFSTASAWAEDPDTSSGTQQEQTATTGTITVQNATNGTTYRIYKLFDAALNADGGISYSGEIPEALESYFTKTSAGNIIEATDEKGVSKFDITSDDTQEALRSWALDQSSYSEATAKGGPVVFSGLDLGYYVMLSSTNGFKVDSDTTTTRAITVSSTTPNATVYDKNYNSPSIATDKGLKTVSDSSVSIGDKLTYTIQFIARNYDKAYQITDYTITDVLPTFLSNRQVTEVMVGGTELTNLQFDENGIMTIAWYSKEDGFKDYAKDGATVTITYTAEVTSNITVGKSNSEDSTKANTNTATVHWDLVDLSVQEEEKSEALTGSADIYTYAAAIKKTADSENGDVLTGAKFTIAGLRATSLGNGVYVVESYDPNATDVVPSELEVGNEDENTGYILLYGFSDDNAKVSLTETQAPDGYNALQSPVNYDTSILVQDAVETITTTTTTTTSEDGTVTTTSKSSVTANSAYTLRAGAQTIVNTKGIELSGTGGIGTTILYVGGALIIICALAGLVIRSRRRD